MDATLSARFFCEHCKRETHFLTPPRSSASQAWTRFYCGECVKKDGIVVVVVADDNECRWQDVRAALRRALRWGVARQKISPRETLETTGELNGTAAIPKANASQPDGSKAVKQVRRVVGNGTSLVDAQDASDPGDENSTETFRLTQRELEILQFVADARTIKETASALGITVRTVETHRASIMRKMDLHSAASLIRYAIRHKRKRPDLAVLTRIGICYAACSDCSAGLVAMFQGRSCSMRLIGWSAIRDRTFRRYASGSRPLSLAVPIRL